MKRPWVGLLAIVVGCFALNLRWLLHFRFGFVTGWDESGYIGIGVRDAHSLLSGGPISLVWEYEKQELEAPLVPLLSVPFNVVAGTGVFQSLLVLLVFAAALTVVTYALASKLLPERWSLLAAFVTASLPVVTDYSRQFHFALPAATFLTAALWALLCSDRLAKRRWVVLFGACVGLMLLARTMTVAYVPGLALVALAQFFARPDDRLRRAVSLGAAAVVAVFVAASWYARNWQTVADYLLGSGYGPDANSYGSQSPVLSWAFLSKELRLVVSELYVPMAVVIALCFLAAIGERLVHRRLRGGQPSSASVLGGGTLALSIVVLEGYLVLTSSRNEGTAFALPWLPSLVVLAVVAAYGTRAGFLRRTLAAMLILISAFNITMKSGWIGPIATPRTVAVPSLGTEPIVDGRGPVHMTVAGAGYPVPSAVRAVPPLHRKWAPFARDVTGWMVAYAADRGEKVYVTVGSNHQLFNQTWITLADALSWHADVFALWIGPPNPGKVEDGYRRFLEDHPENFLITTQAGVEPLPFDHTTIEHAAATLGFQKVKTFRMPDGRSVWLWWHTSPTAGRVA